MEWIVLHGLPLAKSPRRSNSRGIGQSTSPQFGVKCPASYGDQQGMIDIFTFCKGDSVFLVVEDTGPGMSADQIEYLFEPFRSSKNLD